MIRFSDEEFYADSEFALCLTEHCAAIAQKFLTTVNLPALEQVIVDMVAEKKQDSPRTNTYFVANQEAF